MFKKKGTTNIRHLSSRNPPFLDWFGSSSSSKRIHTYLKMGIRGESGGRVEQGVSFPTWNQQKRLRQLVFFSSFYVSSSILRRAFSFPFSNTQRRQQRPYRRPSWLFGWSSRSRSFMAVVCCCCCYIRSATAFERKWVARQFLRHAKTRETTGAGALSCRTLLLRSWINRKYFFYFFFSLLYKENKWESIFTIRTHMAAVFCYPPKYYL